MKFLRWEVDRLDILWKNTSKKALEFDHFSSHQGLRTKTFRINCNMRNHSKKMTFVGRSPMVKITSNLYEIFLLLSLFTMVFDPLFIWLRFFWSCFTNLEEVMHILWSFFEFWLQFILLKLLQNSWMSVIIFGFRWYFDKFEWSLQVFKIDRIRNEATIFLRKATLTFSWTLC